MSLISIKLVLAELSHYVEMVIVKNRLQLSSL